jgi:hypothetical protein
MLMMQSSGLWFGLVCFLWYRGLSSELHACSADTLPFEQLHQPEFITLKSLKCAISLNLHNLKLQEVGYIAVAEIIVHVVAACQNPDFISYSLSWILQVLD